MNTNYREIALVAFFFFFLPVWFGLQTRGEFCPEDRDKGITRWSSPDWASSLDGVHTSGKRGRKINAAPVELWEIWGLAQPRFGGFCGWLAQGRKNHFPCLLRKIIKRYYTLDSVRVIACICWRAFFFGFCQHSCVFHSQPHGSHTAAF